LRLIECEASLKPNLSLLDGWKEERVPASPPTSPVARIQHHQPIPSLPHFNHVLPKWSRPATSFISNLPTMQLAASLFRFPILFFGALHRCDGCELPRREIGLTGVPSRLTKRSCWGLKRPHLVQQLSVCDFATKRKYPWSFWMISRNSGVQLFVMPRWLFFSALLC
jgi:hypothetical protein